MTKINKEYKEYTDLAKEVIAKRYTPNWLFQLFRVFRYVKISFISAAKYIVGSLFLVASFVLTMTVLLVLLPNRVARIKWCNWYGTVFGRVLLFLSGSRITADGLENIDGDRPAIYMCNHTSILDLFIMMWLTPTRTCSVAKKQIVYYPLFGLMYLLSGHLIIDRGNSKSSVARMKALETFVRDNALSVLIFPEGTRSKDGHLSDFKKGFVHMAIQTGLPIVPIIITSAHKGWKANEVAIERTKITISALPAYDTSHWSMDTIDDAIKETHYIFNDHLPADQKYLNPSRQKKSGVLVTNWKASEADDAQQAKTSNGTD